MRYKLFKIRTVKARGDVNPSIIQFGVTYFDENEKPYESIYGALCSPQLVIYPPKTYSRGGFKPTNAVQWSEEFKAELAELFQTREELKKMVDMIQPLRDNTDDQVTVEEVEGR